MSKTSIPSNVINELWFNAHGRCEMCNKPLYRDGLTMQKVNLSENAHIIADSPKGPRGDEELSPLLAKEPSNLILLCRDHHKLIDSAGGVEKFGVDLLRQYKREHEERIEIVTSIAPEKKSMIVCYAPKIGNRNPSITTSETVETLFPEMYPMSLEPIRLEATNIPYDDNQNKYWSIHPDILVENYNRLLRDRIADIPHVSLFAIAPQPLLILLGTLIGDLYKVEVFQKHRDPNSWKWTSESVAVNNNIIIRRPRTKEKDPVLIVALSGQEIIKRIKNQLGDDYAYWIISCEHPNLDMLKNKSQLSSFARRTRLILGEINEAAIGKRLMVFTAMPQACAIKLGQIRLPKSDIPWDVYDLPHGPGNYVKTITIE